MSGKIVTGFDLAKPLIDAGMVPALCRRVVIDIQVGEPVRVYYDTLADEKTVEVLHAGIAQMVLSHREVGTDATTTALADQPDAVVE